MISDKERREVARKLRIQLQYMRKNKEYENDNDVVKCGNLAYRNIACSVEPFGNLEPGNYIHIVDHLADLIDRPTCHDVLGEKAHSDDFECSECGFSINTWDMDGAWLTICYCPNCGVEVVE